jgi:hypothetical protein
MIADIRRCFSISLVSINRQTYTTFRLMAPLAPVLPNIYEQHEFKYLRHCCIVRRLTSSATQENRHITSLPNSLAPTGESFVASRDLVRVLGLISWNQAESQLPSRQQPDLQQTALASMLQARSVLASRKGWRCSARKQDD